jgi:hypothetical protein
MPRERSEPQRSEPQPRPRAEQRRERAELDARYGKIGISAVAAAVRYQSDSRNPAYAPTAHHPHDRDEDAA